MSEAKPKYECAEPGTRIFLAGAPNSGKSEVASEIAASISDCIVQSVDLLRPFTSRDAYYDIGACEAYQAVGDGTYSFAHFIEGYREYCSRFADPLKSVIKSVGSQNATNVLFEGVQVSPLTVRRHLQGRNVLLLLVADTERLADNTQLRYAGDQMMIDRYATDRLCLIQDELLLQAKEMPDAPIVTIPNDTSLEDLAARALAELAQVGTLRPQI